MPVLSSSLAVGAKELHIQTRSPPANNLGHLSDMSYHRLMAVFAVHLPIIRTCTMAPRVLKGFQFGSRNILVKSSLMHLTFSLDVKMLSQKFLSRKVRVVQEYTKTKEKARFKVLGNG